MIFGEQKQRISDYKQTFSSPHGKRVLIDLMNTGHILNDTHVKGDPYTSAFKDGQRSVVCAILKKINIKMEDLEKILKGETE